MRISRKAEYALRALLAIARASPGQLHQIQDLSRLENIPVKFLEQILLNLKHAGFLTSKRGVGGGYTLQRSASAITVGEVLRVIDGPLAPVPCAAADPPEPCSCPDPSTCPLRLMMTRVRHAISAELDALSLETAVQESRGRDILAFDI